MTLGPILRFGCSLFLACVFAAVAARAGFAQEPGSKEEQDLTQTDPHLKPAARRFESPERFVLELRGGPYAPEVGKQAGAGTFFSSDLGPNIGFQLDGVVWREPELLYATVGASFGYIGLSGKALPVDTEYPVSEETTLVILPLIVNVGVRFDMLARKFRIPIIFAARLGWNWAHWDTNTGLRNSAEGWSIGPVFSGQVALDLDAIEPGGARNLDEEWGINHTFLFIELYRFAPLSNQLPVGDTSWLAGLGLVF